jgi:hypothetical protein
MENGPAKDIAIQCMRHPYVVTIRRIEESNYKTLGSIQRLFPYAFAHVTYRTACRRFRNVDVSFENNWERDKHLDRIDELFWNYRVFDRKQAVPLYQGLKRRVY